MLGSFFNRAGSPRGTIAIFDIKEGSIGGALVHFTRGDKPLVRFAHRVTYTKRSTPGSTDQTLLLKAIKTVAEKLCMHALPKLMQEKPNCRGIDEVVLYVGAPFVTIELHEKFHESETGFVVSERWMYETLGSIEKEKPIQGELIEQHTIKALLNGYKSNAPYGKRARRVDLSVFRATAEKAFLDELLHLVNSTMHTKRVRARSATLASFTVIRDHFESEDNFLLVNVSSELAEIALVREDSLAAVSMISRGAHTLLQTASERLKSVPEEVISLLKIRAESGIEEGNKKIQSELALIESDWQRVLDEGFASLKAPHGLPRTVFLIAPRNVSAWFSKLLRSQGSAQHTLTREPFRVVELTGEEMLKHYHVHADVIPDGSLSLETLFLQKLTASVIT